MEKGVKELQTWLLLSVILQAVACEWAVHLPHNQVCAVAGSSVVLPCSFDYPRNPPHNGVERTREELSEVGEEQLSFRVLSEMWCLEQSRCITPRYVYHSAQIFPEPAYRGRVEYLGKPGSKNCSLRISDLSTSDSATYVFYLITNHPVEKLPAQRGVQLMVSSDYAEDGACWNKIEKQESVIGNKIVILGIALAIILVLLVTVACIGRRLRSLSGPRQQPYALTETSQTA
ncbi:uncharacterized protein [Osmerus mordax]|uniref:uncharacterized protein n=1 Tax=Osmerus mordax TaxID=8014 RepID=UPI00351002AF